jgi:hypothetical protein
VIELYGSPGSRDGGPEPYLEYQGPEGASLRIQIKEVLSRFWSLWFLQEASRDAP